ncbi:MAG: hypothetical protein LQ339_007208 [Xanthoria mediterranea]|nr:MAG: hypothetical protein LQ339_007208 [Xanthoria mediterranea]
MAPIDPAVASVLDTHHPSNDYSDEDELLHSLDDDPALDSFREQRLQQLHEEFNKAKHFRNQEHGHYTEINNEKALMDIVNTAADLCVVHFVKSDFHRCGIMNRHLEQLAPLHFETRFLRINVENAPFLVTKMKVQVLPCVIAFNKGISVDRIIGFEGLGYTEDTFSTQDLERRLLQSGTLIRPKANGGHEAGSLHRNHNGSGSRTRATKPDEDDDDWD